MRNFAKNTAPTLLTITLYTFSLAVSVGVIFAGSILVTAAPETKIQATFQKIEGQLHIPASVNLSDLEIGVRVEQSNSKGRRIEREARAQMEYANLVPIRFSIPEISFETTTDSELDSFDWGNRYDYFVSFKAKGTLFAHEFHIWGWDRRPQNDVQYIRSTLKSMLSDLYFRDFSQIEVETAKIDPKLVNDLSWQSVGIGIQAQYFTTPPQITRLFLKYQPGSFRILDSKFEVPKMLHVLSRPVSENESPMIYLDLYTDSKDHNEHQDLSWKGRLEIQDGKILKSEFASDFSH